MTLAVVEFRASRAKSFPWWRYALVDGNEVVGYFKMWSEAKQELDRRLQEDVAPPAYADFDPLGARRYETWLESLKDLGP